MNINVFLNEKVGSWYLDRSSILDHVFHVPSVEDPTTLKSDITDEQLSTLNVLFDSGISPTIITKAMTESVHSSTGKRGAFLAQTIANIGSQERKTIYVYIIQYNLSLYMTLVSCLQLSPNLYLTGFRVRAHICAHSNIKPPCELAISRISRRGGLFWKCECLGYNVK